jgi:hypothetical protein
MGAWPASQCHASPFSNRPTDRLRPLPIHTRHEYFQPPFFPFPNFASYLFYPLIDTIRRSIRPNRDLLIRAKASFSRQSRYFLACMALSSSGALAQRGILTSRMPSNPRYAFVLNRTHTHTHTRFGYHNSPHTHELWPHSSFVTHHCTRPYVGWFLASQAGGFGIIIGLSWFNWLVPRR